MLDVCVLLTIKNPKKINLLLVVANVFLLDMPWGKRGGNEILGKGCHLCVSGCFIL